MRNSRRGYKAPNQSDPKKNISFPRWDDLLGTLDGDEGLQEVVAGVQGKTGVVLKLNHNDFVALHSIGKFSEGLRCLISSGILYTYLNSSREQLRKIYVHV